MAGNLEPRCGKVEPSAHNPYVVGSSPTAATSSLINNNLTESGHGVTAVAQAFWEQVYKTDYCWFWIGPDIKGYGQFSFPGGQELAHRFAFAEANGDIPAGIHIHHDCEIKNCVNPAHLIPLTREEHHDKHRFPRPDFMPEVK